MDSGYIAGDGGGYDELSYGQFCGKLQRQLTSGGVPPILSEAILKQWKCPTDKCQNSSAISSYKVSEPSDAEKYHTSDVSYWKHKCGVEHRLTGVPPHTQEQVTLNSV